MILAFGSHSQNGKNGRMDYGEDTNFPSYVLSVKDKKWKAKN